MNVGGLPCRSCGERVLIPVLSLGETPLANQLMPDRASARSAPRYPLDVVVCGGCWLVQITESIAPETLFRDYVYFSSFSDTMLDHAERLVGETVERRSLNAESCVVEIASNDGYLLQFYKNRGIPVLGVEPAENVARVAREQRGIESIPEFFTAALADKLATEGTAADVVHAHNVLAHVPDMNGFVRGIHTLLKPGGIAIIEVPCVRDLLRQCEFDTIYHEHLSYFSLTSLDALFSRNRLEIVDVRHVPIHGGTLRIHAARAGSAERNPEVAAFLDEEAAWGVRAPKTYLALGQRIAELKAELHALLSQLRAEGCRIAAYGAAAKGSTLLNVFGIGGDLIDFVVDRSPHKQGKFMPGSGLEIFGTERLLSEQPDYVLILAWNFGDEIVEQQAEFRRRGGRFIVPIPDVRVL